MSGLGILEGGIGGAAWPAGRDYAAQQAVSPGDRQATPALPPLKPEEENSGVTIAFSEEALNRAKDDEAPEDNTASPNELSDEEKKQVDQLKQRDQEVRRHEQAHVAAGGPYVRGGANLQYTRGPDGRMYATGGEVSIDVSPARTPEATVQKAQIVRRAALAPAEPSPQDRAVAAAATRLETQARRELSNQRTEKMNSPNDTVARGQNAAEEASAPDSPFEAQNDIAPVSKTLDIRI